MIEKLESLSLILGLILFFFTSFIFRKHRLGGINLIVFSFIILFNTEGNFFIKINGYLLLFFGFLYHLRGFNIFAYKYKTHLIKYEDNIKKDLKIRKLDIFLFIFSIIYSFYLYRAYNLDDIAIYFVCGIVTYLSLRFILINVLGPFLITKKEEKITALRDALYMRQDIKAYISMYNHSRYNLFLFFENDENTYVSFYEKIDSIDELMNKKLKYTISTSILGDKYIIAKPKILSDYKSVKIKEYELIYGRKKEQYGCYYIDYDLNNERPKKLTVYKILFSIIFLLIFIYLI